MTSWSQHSPETLGFRGEGTFLRTVRRRVDPALANCGRIDRRLYRKALAVVAWFLISYISFLMVSGVWQVLACISWGLAACAVGTNVFHDANHGAFSGGRRVNVAMSIFTSTLLGANRYLWWYKHQVLHHRYTNVHRWDDDLETRGNLRLAQGQPWQSKFAAQHWYFFVLYALATLEWLFIKDFVQYFTLRINVHQRVPRLKPAQHVEFWATKSVHFALFVILPVMFMPLWQVVTGLVLYHVVFSTSLTLIFQIAHQVEKVSFPEPVGDPPIIAEGWGGHQMRTTANFATANRCLNWFAGGLNFQIEHHLFPRLSHTLYPKISSIVRQTASEFGLPYHHYSTYTEAVKSHYRFLRELGREPQGAPLHGLAKMKQQSPLLS
jgi:linoleoyl-CoA desaturase